MQTDRTSQALSHHVRLVIDNEQGLYNWRRALAQQALEGPHPQSTLADSLKDMCEQLAGFDESDDMTMFQRELLTTVLDHVDWWEMAQDYIAEEREV